jgi:hypothetical protein
VKWNFGKPNLPRGDCRHSAEPHSEIALGPRRMIDIAGSLRLVRGIRQAACTCGDPWPMRYRRLGSVLAGGEHLSLRLLDGRLDLAFQQRRLMPVNRAFDPVVLTGATASPGPSAASMELLNLGASLLSRPAPVTTNCFGTGRCCRVDHSDHRTLLRSTSRSPSQVHSSGSPQVHPSATAAS